MISDEELYAGFSQDEIERMQREARQRNGHQEVGESEQRVQRMSKEQWQAVQEEGSRNAKGMAALIGEPVANPRNQALSVLSSHWIPSRFQQIASPG